jgi:hypothetical protein
LKYSQAIGDTEYAFGLDPNIWIDEKFIVLPLFAPLQEIVIYFNLDMLPFGTRYCLPDELHAIYVHCIEEQESCFYTYEGSPYKELLNHLLRIYN